MSGLTKVFLEPLEERLLLASLVLLDGQTALFDATVAAVGAISVDGGDITITYDSAPSGIDTITGITLDSGDPAIDLTSRITGDVTDDGADSLERLLTGVAVNYPDPTLVEAVVDPPTPPVYNPLVIRTMLTQDVPTNAGTAGATVGGVGGIDLETADLTGTVEANGGAIGIIDLANGTINLAGGANVNAAEHITATTTINDIFVHLGNITLGNFSYIVAGTNLSDVAAEDGEIVLGTSASISGQRVGSVISDGDLTMGDTATISATAALPANNGPLTYFDSVEVGNDLIMGNGARISSTSSLGLFEVNGDLYGTTGSPGLLGLTGTSDIVAQTIDSFEIGIYNGGLSWSGGNVYDHMHFTVDDGSTARGDLVLADNTDYEILAGWFFPGVTGNQGDLAEETVSTLAMDDQLMPTLTVTGDNVPVPAPGDPPVPWGNLGFVYFIEDAFVLIDVQQGNFTELWGGEDFGGRVDVSGNLSEVWVNEDVFTGSGGERISAGGTIFFITSLMDSIQWGQIESGGNLGTAGIDPSTGRFVLAGGVHAWDDMLSRVDSGGIISGISGGIMDGGDLLDQWVSWGRGWDGVLGTADDVTREAGVGGIGTRFLQDIDETPEEMCVIHAGGVLYYLSAGHDIWARVSSDADLGLNLDGQDDREYTQDDTLFGIFANNDAIGLFEAGGNIIVVNADHNVGRSGLWGGGMVPPVFNQWTASMLATRIYADGWIREVSANGILVNGVLDGGDIAALIHAELDLYFVFAGDDILSAENRDVTVSWTTWNSPEISSGGKTHYIIANDEVIGSQAFAIADGENLRYRDNTGAQQQVAIHGGRMVVKTAFGTMAKIQIFGAAPYVYATDYVGDVTSRTSIEKLDIGSDPGPDGILDTADDDHPYYTSDPDGIPGTGDDWTNVHAVGNPTGLFRLIVHNGYIHRTVIEGDLITAAAINNDIRKLSVIDGNIGTVLAVAYNGVGHQRPNLGGVFTVAGGSHFGYDFLSAGSVVTDQDIFRLEAMTSGGSNDTEGGIIGTVYGVGDLTTLRANWVGPGTEINAYAYVSMYNPFTNAVDYGTGSGPWFNQVGDVNNDTYLDLVVADNVAGTISVLEGNGDGTFNAANSFAVDPSPNELVLGDFDGNGYLDVAVADDGGNVSILLNKGAAATGPADRFQAAVDSSVGGIRPMRIVAGDFTNDGVLDLAVGVDTASGDLYLLEGQGNGTFVDNGFIPSFFFVEPPTIDAVDLNRDGNLDIVAHDPGDGMLYAFLGDGTGSFTELDGLQTESAGQSYIDVGDMNNDLVPDVVLVSEGDTIYVGTEDEEVLVPIAEVYFGVGDGTFREVPSQFDAGSDPNGVAAFDYTGDGNLDIAVTDRDDDVVQVFAGDGEGWFRLEQEYDVGLTPSGVATGDFDGDGWGDLAVSNSGDGDVSVLLRGDQTRVHVGNSPESSGVTELTRLQIRLPEDFFFDVREGRNFDDAGAGEFLDVTEIDQSGGVTYVSGLRNLGRTLRLDINDMGDGDWLLFDIDIDNWNDADLGNHGDLAGSMVHAEFQDWYHQNSFAGSAVMGEGLPDITHENITWMDSYLPERTWGWAHAINSPQVYIGGSADQIVLYQGTESPANLLMNADIKIGFDPLRYGSPQGLNRFIVGIVQQGISVADRTEPSLRSHVAYTASSHIDLHVAGASNFIAHLGTQFGTLNLGNAPFTATSYDAGTIRSVQGHLLPGYIMTRGDVEEISSGQHIAEGFVPTWAGGPLAPLYTVFGGDVEEMTAVGDVAVDMLIAGDLINFTSDAGDLLGDLYILGNADNIELLGSAFAGTDLTANIYVGLQLDNLSAFSVSGNVSANRIVDFEAFGFSQFTGHSVTGNVTARGARIDNFFSAGNVTGVVDAAFNIDAFRAGQTTPDGVVTRVGNVHGTVMAGTDTSRDGGIVDFFITGKVEGLSATPAQVISYNNIEEFTALGGLDHAVVAAYEDMTTVAIGGAEDALISAGFKPGPDGVFAVVNTGVDDVVHDTRGLIHSLTVDLTPGSVYPTGNVKDSIIRSTGVTAEMTIEQGNWVDSLFSCGFDYGVDLELGTDDDTFIGAGLTGDAQFIVKVEGTYPQGPLYGGVFSEGGAYNNILQTTGDFSLVEVRAQLGADDNDMLRAGNNLDFVRSYNDILLDILAGMDGSGNIGTILIESPDDSIDGRLEGDVTATGGTITLIETEGVAGAGAITPAAGTTTFDNDTDGF